MRHGRYLQGGAAQAARPCGAHGGVNLFVYCSGVGHQNPRLDADTEIDTVGVNVFGFTQMVDTMFNYMADNLGGDIAWCLQ